MSDLPIPLKSQQYMRDGKKIDAIKYAREVMGWDLMEAKNACEAWLQKNPSVFEMQKSLYHFTFHTGSKLHFIVYASNPKEAESKAVLAWNKENPNIRYLSDLSYETKVDLKVENDVVIIHESQD